MTLWYLARAAGLVALLTATVAVVLGAFASGAQSRDASDLDRHILRQLAHRSTAVVSLAMLALHAALLVLDSHVDVSMGGALVPFTAGYRGVALGLGTLATYAMVVVALSGAARGRLAASARGARSWRAVHVSAYVGWALAMAHGVLAGTDSGRWWTWPVYGGCGVAVLAAAWVRAGAADRRQESPLQRARWQLTSGGVR